MHSWMKQNVSSDSDSNATFDERISDVIPSTCGGGRRSVGAKSNLSRSTHNNDISPFITPPRREVPAVQEVFLSSRVG